jgi:anti-sigma regulatory factor (Ser/Thr protein kinase)
MMDHQCTITLTGSWIRCDGLDAALIRADGRHRTGCSQVLFQITPGSNLLVDAVVRLLCLCNYLNHLGKTIILHFGDGSSPCFSYLNRIGFFDALGSDVRVLPSRPEFSRAQEYGGGNPGVVEITPVRLLGARDRGLALRLANGIAQICGTDAFVEQFRFRLRTILSELIDNVYNHSESPIDAYAALQSYPGGGSVLATVADSGLGMVSTIRASEHAAEVETLSEWDLIQHLFTRGFSRHGPTSGGAGLLQSAKDASHYSPTIRVRLRNSHCKMVWCRGQYESTYRHNLPAVEGTHLTFEFKLPKTP